MKRIIVSIGIFLCSEFTYSQTTVEVDRKADTIASPLPEKEPEPSSVKILVAPGKDLVIIQLNSLNTANLEFFLKDTFDKTIQRTILYQGSTLASFNTHDLPPGKYFVKVNDGGKWFSKTITLIK